MFEKLKELQEDNENGFTLIELLVVILIIGILAAIAIPVFLNQRKTANDGVVQSDVRNAATQVQSWITTKGGSLQALPADLSVMDIKTTEGVTLSVTGDTNNYCIVGYHENGDRYVSPLQASTFDSAAGGLKTDGGTCAGGTSADGDTNETPIASLITMTKGEETKEFSATAGYNAYGGTVIYLTSDDASVSGSIDGNFRYYCGTSPGDGGMIFGSFSTGTAALNNYMPPSECTDGISFTTGDWSEWKMTGESAVVAITGTVPEAPANNGGYEPQPEPTYPTVSIAGSGSDSGFLWSMDYNTGEITQTEYTWNIDYTVSENGEITYTFTSNKSDLNASDYNAHISLNDGGYGNGRYIDVYMNIVNGQASDTTTPGFAVDGSNLSVAGQYAEVGGYRLAN